MWHYGCEALIVTPNSEFDGRKDCRSGDGFNLSSDLSTLRDVRNVTL